MFYGLDLEGSPTCQLISKFDHFLGESPKDIVS
jgi:hypothetical protein